MRYSSTSSERLISLHEKLVIAAVTVVFGYPAWVWGGGTSYMTVVAVPMLWISCAALALLILAPMFTEDSLRMGLQSSCKMLSGLFRDPFIYAGLGILAIVAIQFLNARWPDVDMTDWLAGTVRWRRLPSAVAAPEAMLVFCSFLNAIVGALCVRHGLKSRRAVRKLFQVMLWNASAIAAFGVVQYFSTTDSLYWFWPRRRHFFAGFYYENHAGQFFYMMFSLSVAILAHQICRMRVTLNRKFLVPALSVPLLLFLACIFSLSRTSIVLVCALLIWGSVYTIRRLPSSVNSLSRLYLITGMIAVCIFGLVIVSGTVMDDIRKDFATRKPGQSLVEQAYEVRLWQWEAAWDMWQKHPVEGVGSYGFRYYLPYYTPPSRVNSLWNDAAGNVHNDWLYFLCEHGLLGALPILTLFYFLIRPVFSWRPALRKEMVQFPLISAVMIVLHSMWDLPFRCPAVFSCWAIIVAGAGLYVSLLKDRDQTMIPE